MAKSLRWRIQIWHGVILAAVILLFGTLTYLQQRQSRNVTTYNELRAAVEVLSGQLQSASPEAMESLLDGSYRNEPSPNLFDWNPEPMRLYNGLQVPRTFAPRRYHHEFEHPYFIIWDAAGNVVKASVSAPSIPCPKPSVVVFKNSQRSVFRQRQDVQELFVKGPQGTTVLAGRNVRADFEDLRNLAYLLTGSGAVVFAFGLLGGWFLSGRSVRPIEHITRVAADISEKNLSDRIDISDTDSELSELAQTLNETFARLQSAFERQVQFTADASHELRTPLSVVQMHQELALSRERTPEEYRAAIETCQRATTRMNVLVESLLTLARLETEDTPLVRQSEDIAKLVADCCDQVAPLTESKGVRLSTSLVPVVAECDRDQLVQVVTNLLTNAIAYSPPESEISISLQQTGNQLLLSITDSGVGIPETDLPHIFDRFYRVDKQRTRDSGGSGLGLSICKKIVEAHGGEIKAESIPGQGSTFHVTLPMTVTLS